MKERLDWIAILLIGLNSLLVLALIIFLIYGLNPVFTGPIGDTFGGLLSPIIGIVSIVFLYKTFESQREQLSDQKIANDAMISAQREQLEDQKRANVAQREQLEDQKKQFEISRISDILYLQIQRIDQTLENITFYPQGGVTKVEGIAGIYGLNETLKDVFDSKQFANENGLDLKNNELPHYLNIINNNLEPLLHLYNVVLNSLKIVTIMVSNSNMPKNEGDNIKGLLLMNIGRTINLNVYRLLWLFNDATELQDYDYQAQQLHDVVSDIEKYFHEEQQSLGSA